MSIFQCVLLCTFTDICIALMYVKHHQYTYATLLKPHDRLIIPSYLNTYNNVSH